MKEKSIYQEKIVLEETPEQPVPWHAYPEDKVLKRLQATLEGLEPQQVLERQQEFGKNILPTRKPPGVLQIFLHQFASPLIYILLVAGLIAFLMGDVKDAAFILAVILLNAGIGTYQEWRAEQSAHSLQTLLKIQARVRRQGVQRQILADDLVPGDVVFLESGDKVPADLRLFQVNNLTIDESFLTGESLAVEKRTNILDADLPVSERANMAYAGSTVASGRGLGLVVATGIYTEVGKIARTITEEEGAKAPLVIRMEQFARQISFVILVFAGLLGILAFFQGMPFNEVFFLVIAMAVSAIPEGLPVAMTVALSIATARMAKRNVIVRKLPAVESLGSCTCIASDKTGTLTVNQQTVKLIELPDGKRIHVSGEGYNDQGRAQMENGQSPPAALQSHLQAIAEAGALCNEATLTPTDNGWNHHGDAIDVALLALGYKLGVNPSKLHQENETVAEIPFESERRYAAKAVRKSAVVQVAVKGAVESLLPFCHQMRSGDETQPLNSKAVEERALAMAEAGYRVLAIATGELPPDMDFSDFDESKLPPLTLLGLVGFIDPLRPEVKESVTKASQAGIKVVMITGDHPATAFAIASELGIAFDHSQVVTGHELAELDSYEVPEFYELVKSARVFARVTPIQKLHIVEALMKLGHFVAVTGDGVNDAPALRKANIGVAMGSGTDVAKDTASMIVTDDNFSSIVAGIEEGRFAYSNVRKVTLLLISTGAAELLLISLAILFQLPIPLLAVQILWLNLVTNGIQDVALAFEAGEEGVMKLPPRKPTEGIFNRLMIQQVMLSGATMGIVCFGTWFWMMRAGVEEVAARNLSLLLLVLMQFYHVFNCRSEYQSVFRIPLRNNRVLVLGMLTAFGIHVLATQAPLLQSILRTAPVPVEQWALFGLIASVVMVVMEVFKMTRGYRLQNHLKSS